MTRLEVHFTGRFTGLGGKGANALFLISENLGAKAAAHIGNHNPQLVFRDARRTKDPLGHQACRLRAGASHERV